MKTPFGNPRATMTSATLALAMLVALGSVADAASTRRYQSGQLETTYQGMVQTGGSSREYVEMRESTEGPRRSVFMLESSEGPRRTVFVQERADGPRRAVYMLEPTEMVRYVVSMQDRTDGPRGTVSMQERADGPRGAVSMQERADGPRNAVSMQERNDAARNGVSMQVRTDGPRGAVSMQDRIDAVRYAVSVETDPSQRGSAQYEQARQIRMSAAADLMRWTDEWNTVQADIRTQNIQRQVDFRSEMLQRKALAVERLRQDRTDFETRYAAFKAEEEILRAEQRQNAQNQQDAYRTYVDEQSRARIESATQALQTRLQSQIADLERMSAQIEGVIDRYRTEQNLAMEASAQMLADSNARLELARQDTAAAIERMRTENDSEGDREALRAYAQTALDSLEQARMSYLYAVQATRTESNVPQVYISQ